MTEIMNQMNRMDLMQINLSALQERIQAIPRELVDVTDLTQRQNLITEYANAKLQHEIGKLELQELAKRQGDLVSRFRYGSR